MIDVLDDQTYSLLLKNARNNTDIYRRVFKCIPDDSIRAVKDIK